MNRTVFPISQRNLPSAAQIPMILFDVLSTPGSKESDVTSLPILTLTVLTSNRNMLFSRANIFCNFSVWFGGDCRLQPILIWKWEAILWGIGPRLLIIFTFVVEFSFRRCEGYKICWCCSYNGRWPNFATTPLDIRKSRANSWVVDWATRKTMNHRFFSSLAIQSKPFTETLNLWKSH